MCQDASVISWNCPYITPKMLGKAGAQPPLNNPEQWTYNAFGQTTLPFDLLSNFTTMGRGACGTHVSHLRGRQCSHHQSTRPGSSSSRLNGILNMAVLTLRAAIKHLEEFSPSNYICHCQPFSENRDCSP